MQSNTILLVGHGSDAGLHLQLEERGYTVVDAADAAAALGAANRSEIALVVTELYLPVGKWPCLARAIRRSPALQRTKVLAHTTHGRRKDRAWAKRVGADGYVLTRSGDERLLQVVDRLMRKRSAADPASQVSPYAPDDGAAFNA